MLKIALTGGIGSGKSAVSKLFAAQHVPIIDADLIAKELLMQPSIEQQIMLHFGDAVVTHQHLDVQLLKQKIFTDAAAKDWLEKLLHPQILQQIMLQLTTLEQTKHRYVIIVIPLLVEKQLTELFDRTLVVDCGFATQYQRIRLRDNLADDLIAAMINQQAPRAKRLLHADDVILNDLNVTLEKLTMLVLGLHQKYTTLG